MISFNAYLFLSCLLATLISINAYTLHEQFYPTMIFLTTSKLSKIVILNMLFAIFLGTILFILRIFFTSVRESEKLSILEKLKRKVFDFFLVVLVFREDSLDTTFFGIKIKNELII
jgi:E3 ubiquitin-protein ligase synoviolin